MGKEAVVREVISDCRNCEHAIKDRTGEIIGCRNGTDKPCDYREREW